MIFWLFDTFLTTIFSQKDGCHFFKM